MSLRGQHVLITGGSSGIGLALARQSASEGGLSLVARDRAEAVDAARSAAIAGAPNPEWLGRIVALSADVALECPKSWARYPGAEEKVHGPIDVLIACAGVSRPGYFTGVACQGIRKDDGRELPSGRCMR